jgi:hypothetical protein
MGCYTRPQPPPPMTPMVPTRVTPSIGQHVVTIVEETKPACLRLPRQGGTYREAFFKENFKGRALLHHKFFCKEEW